VMSAEDPLFILYVRTDQTLLKYNPNLSLADLWFHWET
jgi:hypothetical protein